MTAILDVLDGTLSNFYETNDFTLSTGTEGKWLTVSLVGACIFALFIYLFILIEPRKVGEGMKKKKKTSLRRRAVCVMYLQQTLFRLDTTWLEASMWTLAAPTFPRATMVPSASTAFLSPTLTVWQSRAAAALTIPAL